MSNWDSFRGGQSGQCVKLTTHLHPMPRVIMIGGVGLPPLPHSWRGALLGNVTFTWYHQHQCCRLDQLTLEQAVRLHIRLYVSPWLPRCSSGRFLSLPQRILHDQESYVTKFLANLASRAICAPVKITHFKFPHRNVAWKAGTFPSHDVADDNRALSIWSCTSISSYSVMSRGILAFGRGPIQYFCQGPRGGSLVFKGFPRKYHKCSPSLYVTQNTLTKLQHLIRSYRVAIPCHVTSTEYLHVS